MKSKTLAQVLQEKNELLASAKEALMIAHVHMLAMIIKPSDEHTKEAKDYIDKIMLPVLIKLNEP